MAADFCFCSSNGRSGPWHRQVC